MSNGWITGIFGGLFNNSPAQNIIITDGQAQTLQATQQYNAAQGQQIIQQGTLLGGAYNWHNQMQQQAGQYQFGHKVHYAGMTDKNLYYIFYPYPYTTLSFIQQKFEIRVNNAISIELKGDNT